MIEIDHEAGNHFIMAVEHAAGSGQGEGIGGRQIAQAAAAVAGEIHGNT